MKKILIPFVLIVSLCTDVLSQGACTQLLSEAEDLYEAGRLYEVTKKLNEGTCLEGGKLGFSKEERIRAYRLLALVYLFMDNEPDAEDAVVKLLHVDPEHPENDPNDPAELKYLFAKYRSKPIFRIALFVGGNNTSIVSNRTYIFANANENRVDDLLGNGFDSVGTQISKRFESRLGVNFGIGVEYMVYDNIEILVRAKFVTHNYDISYDIISNNDEVNDATDPFDVNIIEDQTWLQFPVAVRYNIPLGEFKPYLMAGGSFNFLVNSRMSGSRGGLGTNVLTNLDVTSDELNMREKLNWSYFGGIGAKLDVKRTNSFFLEATYSLGARNFVNASNRMAAQELNFGTIHVDDDKMINSLSIKLGYIRSFYNPKKYSAKKLQKVNLKKAKKNDR